MEKSQNILNKDAFNIAINSKMFGANLFESKLSYKEVYKNMNDADDEVCAILDDIFNKANEADEEYATIINSEVTEMEDLIAEFESSMQMAG